MIAPMDKVLEALASTLGDPKGWEQIEPVRRLIPASIQRKEAELVEAQGALDMAETLHVQARTDATLDTLLHATEKVNRIALDLDGLRVTFYQHPEYFEEE